MKIMEATEADQEISVDAHHASNAYPNTFPAAFVEYCIQNALPPELFKKIIKLTKTLPRYVRVHRAWWDYFRQNTDSSTYVKYSKLISQQELQTLLSLHQLNEAKKIEIMHVMLAEELHLSMNEVKHVSWLPYCPCFALPANVSLHSSHMYQLGFIIGMDAASMAAVLALQPRHGDMVLDVCCAPGMKLNLIADMIRGNTNTTVDHEQKAVSSVESQEVLQHHKANIVESTFEEQNAKKSNRCNVSEGVVIGVDANLDRLYTCRSIVRKHENAYKISEPKIIVDGDDNESVSPTFHLNYCANVNNSNVALFLADGCTFTLPAALQTLLVTSQQKERECELHADKTHCAAIHDNTGLTSHEERKLNKLKTINSDCTEANNTSSQKTTNNSNNNKRERVSHSVKCDTSINNGNPAQCTVSERKRANTQVHIVYAPKSVREHLIKLEQSSDAQPSLSSSELSSRIEHEIRQTTELLFDKVLVDAECTHDGSLCHLCLGSPLPKNKNVQNNLSLANKEIDACVGVSNTHRMAHIHINNAKENSKITHITNISEEDHIKHVKEETLSEEELEQHKLCLKKEEEEQLKNPESHVASDHKQNNIKVNICSDLFMLQLGLLRNGFAQLKVNGTLVYCTCSFAYAQDENVVLHFINEYNANSLHSHLKAVLVPPFSFIHKANETYNSDSDDSNNHHNTLIPFLKVYDALQFTLDSCKDYCHVVRDGAKLCEREYVMENNYITQHDTCKEYKQSTIDNSNNKNENDHDSMNANSKDQNVYVGSRFWPHLFHTSFQYVAKIMKVKVEENIVNK